MTRTIHTCACGAEYTLHAWLALRLVGRQPDYCGGVLELRECRCGSTRAVQICDGRIDLTDLLIEVEDHRSRISSLAGKIRDCNRTMVFSDFRRSRWETTNRGRVSATSQNNTTDCGGDDK